jgi:hypothetical protein
VAQFWVCHETALGDDAEGWWWCGHAVGSVWLKEVIWGKKAAGAQFLCTIWGGGGLVVGSEELVGVGQHQVEDVGACNRPVRKGGGFWDQNVKTSGGGSGFANDVQGGSDLDGGKFTGVG